MSEELERLKRARPDVVPPSEEARTQAVARLRAAVEHELGVPREPAAQAGAMYGQPSAPEQTGRPRRKLAAGRRRGSIPSPGTVLVVIASVAAVVLAAGALLVLHHGAGRSTAGTGKATARGEILDRAGHALVAHRVAYDVQVSRASLPTAAGQRAAELTQLARVLGMSVAARPCPIPHGGSPRLPAIACAITRQQAVLPGSTATVATDRSAATASEISAHSGEFPGVVIKQTEVRYYPRHTLAAQLFGTVGPITAAEVHGPRYQGVSSNAIVGQSGLEYEYDAYLRAGDTLRLTLDAGLQTAGEQALARAIAANHGSGGAFVAMNPNNGAVYAIGSAPSFDPNILNRPITQSRYGQLFGPGSGSPQLDRAIAGAAVGSTFAPITATAALQSGVWSVGQTYDDTGQFCQQTMCRHNTGGAAYGVLTLVNAIRVSSDVFLYNLGVLTNTDPVTHPSGGPLQQWANAYGIGRPTGIDLPGECAGTLPTPRWRASRNRLEQQCDNLTHPTPTFPNHPNHKLAPGGCGIADGTNRPWSAGDNVNLAVGQGDVQVTPLQLVTAYSAIANGGTIVKPHVGLEVDSPSGAVLQKIQPPPARHLNINPTYLDTIRAGLRAAASQPGGTSADVFGNFPEQVYGKTGTAQYNGKRDYAWYACFVPSSATSRPIVIVVSVEQGGFGAIAAAPVARQMLSQWFFGNKGRYVPGHSTTL